MQKLTLFSGKQSYCLKFNIRRLCSQPFNYNNLVLKKYALTNRDAVVMYISTIFLLRRTTEFKAREDEGVRELISHMALFPS